MKTIAALLVLVAALTFAPSIASPAQAQPCQWNYTFVNGVATATYCGSVVTQGGIIIPNVNTVANIAALETLAAPAISQGSVWTVLGYHTSNDGGGGQFVLAAGACNNSGAGDGGTQFPSTVTSTCWTRLGIVDKVSLPMFGSYGDGTHDDTASIQNWSSASATLGVAAYCPAGTYKITSTITMSPGDHYIGQIANVNATQPICIFIPTGFNSTQVVFDLENANGVNTVAAPTFEGMMINGGQNQIRYNNVNNGFTNDNTTQAPMNLPIVKNMFFSQGGSATGIAIQCSKCFQGTFDNNTFFGGGGAVAIDLEGSDHFVVSHNSIGGSNQYLLEANAHGTFGNDLVVNNQNRFLQPGVSATNYILDTYRTSWIDNNFFEGPNTISCAVSISGGFQFEMSNNDWSGTGATNPLCVTDASNGLSGSGYLTIDVRNNTGNGSVSSPPFMPSFNGGAGIAYFANNQGGIRKITHNGNWSTWGDTGWPMNSLANSQTNQLPPITSAYWSCNNDGLAFSGFGLTVKCQSGYFLMSSTGSGNILHFGSGQFAPQTTGIVDLWILASSATGGAINGCVTDNDVCTSAFVNVGLATAPKWVNPQTSQTTTTAAGAQIYSTTSDVHVWAVALTPHSGL